MDDVSFINLRFKDSSGQWNNLPKWADFFISVGEQLALADFDTASRVVTAIVVPTRAYCVAFISLGIAIGDVKRKDIPSEVTHFKNLLDLPPGTSVIYHRGSGESYKGIMKSPQKLLRGEQWVSVQVSVSSKKGGGQTFLINEAKALKVQLAKHSGKLPQKQSGKDKHFSNEFANSLLGGTNPVQLGIQSKLACTIIGKKNLLEYEIRQTPFAVQVRDGRRIEGYLQDVLRVDRFFTGGQFHRFALIPVGVSQPSNDTISKTEIGVVFDGAAGFRKWGKEMCPDRHQIIILDRTEPYFDDACHAINSRFLQNRATTELPLPYSDMSPPPGTEVLAFREMVP